MRRAFEQPSLGALLDFRRRQVGECEKVFRLEMGATAMNCWRRSSSISFANGIRKGSMLRISGARDRMASHCTIQPCRDGARDSNGRLGLHLRAAADIMSGPW